MQWIIILYFCLTCNILFLFQASDLTVDITSRPGIKPAEPEKCLFGKHFTDHMFQVEWSRSSGWGVPQIKPVQNLSIHPGTSCLHYAIQVRVFAKMTQCFSMW